MKRNESTSIPNDSELQAQAALLGAELVDRGLTVATAESCTGGWIAKTFTDLAGSSDWFNGGVVTYSNEAKHHLLGVDMAVLDAHGAVSGPVVEQMATGALGAVGAHCAVSVSGVAGPGGGTRNKPVGTVWIAAAIRGDRDAAPDAVFGHPGVSHERSAGVTGTVRIKARAYRFDGSRDEIRRASVGAAIGLLRQVLDSD